MERTERCVSISEPNSIYPISAKYRKHGESAELRQAARDVIRLECRPYETMQPPPLGYLIKLNAGTCVGLPLLRKLFPNSRCLFMYRDVVTVAQSTYRITMNLPSARLVYLLGQITADFTKLMVDAMGFDGNDFRVRLDNELTAGVVLAIITTRAYLDERRKGFDVSAVRYEDLVARPLDMCRVILAYCQLPVSLAERAVTAFDVDSQRNSVLAKSIVGRYSEPLLTPSIKTRLNELLKENELPLIGEAGILEGTLVCSS